MKRYIFKYASELTSWGVVHRPVALVHLESKDGAWYLFIPYVDSGADISLFSRSDASLLKLDLSRGDYRPIMGVGRVLTPAYVHVVKMKIGETLFDAKIAFADSDEVPRLLGREEVFKRFKITFDEVNLQTVFELQEK